MSIGFGVCCISIYKKDIFTSVILHFCFKPRASIWVARKVAKAQRKWFGAFGTNRSRLVLKKGSEVTSAFACFGFR